MSKSSWAQTDDKDTNIPFYSDAPDGQVQDDSYVTSKQSEEPIPVQGDNEPVEDPMNAESASSNKQLEQDEREAIDESNIIDERTRHAKPTSSYEEMGDKKLGLTE